MGNPKLHYLVAGTGAAPTAVRCLRCQVGLQRWLELARHRDTVLGLANGTPATTLGTDGENDCEPLPASHSPQALTRQLQMNSVRFQPLSPTPSALNPQS